MISGLQDRNLLIPWSMALLRLTNMLQKQLDWFNLCLAVNGTKDCKVSLENDLNEELMGCYISWGPLHTEMALRSGNDRFLLEDGERGWSRSVSTAEEIFNWYETVYLFIIWRVRIQFCWYFRALALSSTSTILFAIVESFIQRTGNWKPSF